MKKIVTSICIGLLTACTSTSDTSSTNNANSETVFQDFVLNQELSSVDRVAPFILSDYMVLDKQFVALETRNRKYFLASVSQQNCADLNFAERIGVLQHEKDVLNVSDQIVRVGFEDQGCIVNNLYKLNKVQYEELSNINIRRRYNTSVNAPTRF
ncbi:hypothetical protein GCM10009092_20900 [Bowmanella denitrificans]|uniref:Lipoprotein n=1 Tax=Bowmanella denitrificans TaxID=366582 RepID=A0ABN0X6R5_9ALTE